METSTPPRTSPPPQYARARKFSSPPDKIAAPRTPRRDPAAPSPPSRAPRTSPPIPRARKPLPEHCKPTAHVVPCTSAFIFSRTSRAQTNCDMPHRNKRNTNPRACALSHPAPARSHVYSPAHSPPRPHSHHQTESPNPIPPAATHPPATNPPKSAMVPTPSSPAHTNHEKIFSPASLRAIPPAPPDAAGKSGNPSPACAQQHRHYRQTRISCSPFPALSFHSAAQKTCSSGTLPDDAYLSIPANRYSRCPPVLPAAPRSAPVFPGPENWAQIIHAASSVAAPGPPPA